MCAIFGSYGLSISSSLTAEISKLLAHRGPDYFGYSKIQDNIYFSHYRLSINDLSSSGNQPMVDAKTGNILIFNGEIYNFKVLKNELINLGYQFSSTSDSEVLLVGYNAWGKRILDKISGMFAFAIWDNAAQEIFIARDRLGEKPLFIKSFDGNSVAFCSELLPLLAICKYEFKFSKSAIFEYLNYGYSISDNTLISDIHKLPPAHYVVIKKGVISKPIKYWDIAAFFLNKKLYLSIESAINELNGLIENSINQQLISDAPLGSFISGGIDSTTLTAKISKHIPNIETFCLGFQNKEFDETGLAKKIANDIGVSFNSFILDEITFKEIIEPYLYFDEPIFDSSAIATYYLSKFSRQKVKVAISGDGGDELFLGYPTYTADRLYMVTKFLPRWIFVFLDKLIGYFPSDNKKLSLNYKLKAFIKGSISSNFLNAHMSWRILFSNDEILSLTSSSTDLFPDIDQTHLDNILNKYSLSKAHYLDQASYIDIHTWLANDILVKVDRMSMANSLEVRAPLLDHKIVEFAASLPVYLKSSFIFGGKLPIKRLYENNIKIKRGRKKGFSSPFSNWIIKYRYDFEHFIIQELPFNSKAIEKLIEDHCSFKSDNSHKISALFALSCWNFRIKKLKKEIKV